MFSFLSRLFKKKEPGIVRDVASLTAELAVAAVQIQITEERTGSYFGGRPVLPNSVQWPEKDGRKLDFLACFSLQEVHAARLIDWLPESGQLLFFYDTENQPWGFDPKDRGSFSVIYITEDSKVTPTVIAEIADKPSPLTHRNICYREILVLPPMDSDSIRAFNFSYEELDSLAEVTDKAFNDKPKHQISGFPAPVQGYDMQLECQLASNGVYCGDPSGYEDPKAKLLGRQSNSWRLLFQLDSDDELDIMWGDCGTIYFWIEEHLSKKGDFTNSWLVLQCA